MSFTEDMVQSMSLEASELEFHSERTADHPTEHGQLVHVKISPKHFDLLKLLGEGAFGKVLLVRNRLTGALHAMKVISKALLRKKNNVAYMKSEREILTKLHHPFLVHLDFAFHSPTKLFLVMDFLAGGELFTHLRRRGIILEKDVQFYISEMILALDFLHSQQIVHRDLKPENILLRFDGHICITDFGLAKELGDGTTTRTLCGTSEYMAPEMLSRTGYGKAVDFWALGALTFEMLTSRPPFVAKVQKELDRKILTEKLSLPSFLTGACCSLLKGLLDRDSARRLGCCKSTMFSIGGVTALKQHAFFHDINWQAIASLEGIPPIDLSAAAIEPLEYFDIGFTAQIISRSLIEDSLSRTTSPCDDLNEYEDFDFGTVACSQKEIEALDSELMVREAKLMKKNTFKQKTQALKMDALRKEEEEMEVRQQEQAMQKAKEDALKAEAQAFAAARAAVIATNKTVQQHNAKVAAYQEALAGLQKKLKTVRKKLKDVEDLATKSQGSKLDADQQAKLSKLPLLQAEQEDLVKEMDVLIKTDPGPLQEEQALPATDASAAPAAALAPGAVGTPTVVPQAVVPGVVVPVVPSSCPFPPTLLAPKPVKAWAAITKPLEAAAPVTAPVSAPAPVPAPAPVAAPVAATAVAAQQQPAAAVVKPPPVDTWAVVHKGKGKKK